jgi:hypothetical protein
MLILQLIQLKMVLINLIKMKYYLQQFKETSLIKRDSVKIDLAFVLIKYTNLQNIFSDTCNWFKHCFQSYP